MLNSIRRRMKEMTRVLLAMVIVIGLFMISIDGASAKALGIWLLDDEGEVATDFTENGNDGKLSAGVNWSEDAQVGGSIEGAGGGWIDIPNSESLTRATGPFTMMAWVKTKAPGQYGIFAKSADAPVSHQDWGLYVWDGFVRFAGNWPEAWTDAKFTSKNPVEVDRWTHLAVTWGDAKLIIYIDGELDTAFDWDDNFKDTEVSITIGADLAGGDEPINGFIDEVAMFDEVLSKEDIQKAMAGIENFLAMEPSGKLPITWGAVKEQY
jgi:concanavalin A-like lectin/glucanase superfamily protein